jgi:tetratricopeptide (TPR) repeat protein
LRFIVKEKPSQSLLELLTNELEYVHEGVHFSEGDPSRFYSGFGLGWYPIIKNFDVRRQLLNKLLEDIVLRTENDRPSKIELYAIKAEAGAGKSILLRRLAWEAAINAGVLCLYGRGTTSLNFEPLREISTATAQRIFLFIDNAADNMLLIHEIIEFARSNKLSLTIITAERANEWNVRCESLENYLSDQYHLAYLNHSEIENLVNLLTKFNALGPNLSIKTFEEQVNEFEKKAGRQLLVALHEATHGRPFEEILIDEYNNIIPQEAQRLYLTVCVLNRLGVPVRAGLISRVHGIPFEMFQDRLFEPLEHVVQVIKLPWGDLAYQARHSEIAKIVFDQILTDSAEKFNEYIRIIKALNPVFSVDYQSLRGMLRAKWIHDLFPNFEDAKAIYQSADNILKDDAYLFQQMANYERIRPNGNFLYAQTLLERARVLEPSNHTIVHTLAEVLRARAESTQKKLEKARFRKEARSLLQNIPDTASSAKYAVVTQLKICIDFVRESLIDESSTDRDIDEAIRDTERAFENGRQRYPGDSFILTAEAEFAKLLKDHQRAFDALKQARRLNPRDPFLATRLAALLASNGDLDTAKTYLEEALESNRGDRRLNFQFAELLRLKGESSPKDLIYFYRRAFIKGDHNYQSQFWYARFAFESKDSEKIRESKEIFKYLRETPMAYEERIRIQDAVGGLNSPRQFSGTISRVEATHGFLTTDGSGDRLFFHETDVVGGVWDRLISGTRVIFAIGFNLRGPKAYDLRIEGVSL